MTNIIKTLAFGAALTVAACGASPAYAEFFDIPKPDTSQREYVAKTLKELFPELPVNSEPVMMEHPFQLIKCYTDATNTIAELERHGFRTQGQSILGGIPTVLMISPRGAYVIYGVQSDTDTFCILMKGMIDMPRN